MSFTFVFLLSSYFLIFLGFIGLLFTGEPSFPYKLLAGVAFIVGALGEVGRGKVFLPGSLANIAILGVFVLSLFSIFVLKALPLQELVHFLLALQAVKLLAPKKGRDWLQLYLLSFFNLIAASALSVEVSFAVIFVCYLFVAPWVLVLFHLKGAMEETGKDPDRETHLLSWSLFRLVGGTGGVLFFLTLTFFLVFPRFGVGFLGDVWASGSAVTGFSDRLSLGEVAAIKKNEAVAMRVSIDQPGRFGGREFYWRGLALDLFDGRKWERSKTSLTPLRRVGGAYLVDEWVGNTAPLIRQEIILEPTGSPALFTLSKPMAISGKLRHLFRDPLGNIRAAFPFPFQISYEVFSYLEASRPEEALVSNFLQLPAMDSRIVLLSRRLTEGVSDELKKARALERYLRENYRYSLEGLPVGGGDPLALFLFEVRQGDCEYFSSALAVMLRSLGIPARVVNGYLGGNWNPYGEYYLIRQSDAHSWVEAYFANQGWVTLDPTPPAPEPEQGALLDSMAHLVDFLRMRWYRYVVNFDLSDQYQLFIALKRPYTWFDSGLRGFSASELRQWFLVNSGWGMGMGFLLGILVIGWSWLSRQKRAREAYVEALSHQATQRYRHFLALLRKRGLRKRPGETPDEFSQVAGREGNGLVKEFTSLYQQARFSSCSNFADGLKRMDQILMQLENGQGLPPNQRRIRRPEMTAKAVKIRMARVTSSMRLPLL